MGFGKKGKSSFTVHRSEEVLPDQQQVQSDAGSGKSGSGVGGRQPSSASSDGDGEGSVGEGRSAYLVHSNSSIFSQIRVISAIFYNWVIYHGRFVPFAVYSLFSNRVQFFYSIFLTFHIRLLAIVFQIKISLDSFVLST